MRARTCSGCWRTSTPATRALPASTPVRRLRRAERREQLLAAATRAFARTGFAATSLDDIAAAAGIRGFRLLFRHAAREPEFRPQMDRFHRGMVATARRELARIIPDRAWVQWAAQLAPVVAIEAVMAWLDAGQPDRDQAADRIRQALAGVIAAAQQP